jgi:DNA-binding transcriptional LysR family regulator
MMNWDDLRIFLVVARRKKLASAAADLKLDITTISRRIKRLEDSVGQTLFERLRTGHVLTSHGNSLFTYAEQIETGFEAIGRPKYSTPNSPSGTVRISVAEGFGAELLAPVLGQFKTRFPDIEIDLVSGSGFLSLSKREADVAIGLARSKSKHIVSELLRTYQLHLYAHQNYFKTHPTIEALSVLNHHTLIDYVDDLIYSDKLRYFEEHLSGFRPTIRSTSIIAQKNLVANGAGLAILPDFLAQTDFKKVLPDQIQLKRQFWFSYHQSVAPLGKIKAFRAFAISNLANEI